jgi:hypothetical protein
VADATFDLKVFPNPAKDMVNISFDSNYNGIGIFSLKNMSGQTIHLFSKNIFNGKNQVPLRRNSLPSGIYILEIMSEKKIWKEKIVLH